MQSSSAAATSFFDLTSAFESDVLGLDGEITESSNEFTDFENFEVEEVARGKTRDAMQAINHPGVGITLETTALRVTWNDTWVRRKALKSRQRPNFVILEAWAVHQRQYFVKFHDFQISGSRDRLLVHV